jgi:hypothetical protein
MTELDKPEQTAVNGSGTDLASDTPLTHPCSPDVLRDLLVKRNKVGAETPLGYLLSNLIMQLWNYEKETDPTARANLERFMDWSIAAIQKAA